MAETNPLTDELSREVVRIQTGILALVCAVMGGLGLLIMTLWLRIKDGPGAGPHLVLLSHYFIGYSVTWTGSLIGCCYGAVTGGLVGWVVGKVYNLVAGIRQRGRQQGL